MIVIADWGSARILLLGVIPKKGCLKSMEIHLGLGVLRERCFRTSWCNIQVLSYPFLCTYYATAHTVMAYGGSDERFIINFTYVYQLL